MFEQGDGTKPIAIGLMQEFQGGMTVAKDDGIHEITAGKELTLRCGKALITLREDGTIETRGEDIFSKARKNHKIKGGDGVSELRFCICLTGLCFLSIQKKQQNPRIV